MLVLCMLSVCVMLVIFVCIDLMLWCLLKVVIVMLVFFICVIVVGGLVLVEVSMRLGCSDSSFLVDSVCW